MKENKKWLLAGVIVVICLALIVFVDNGFSNRLNAENDAYLQRTAPVLLDEASNEMPKSSAYTYGISEYQILNDVASQGMVVRQYKRIFKNTARKDYSVENAYMDFAEDMEEYKTNLGKDIAMLKGQRPALDNAKYEQANTVKKLEALYSVVADYKNHVHNLNDTLRYLDDCEYALNRVYQQSKLPME